MKALHLIAIAAMQLLTAAGVAAEDFEAGPLRIEDPWTRPTAGDAGAAAAYLEIENTGTTADRLISARADIAERTELHESVEEAGVAKMQPLKQGIEIPAGGEVKLKPLGMHVMLLGLKQKLEEDQSFPLTLTFEKQGDMQITVEVESNGGHDHDGHSKH